jgi:universal stress protein E
MRPIRRILVTVSTPQARASAALARAVEIALACGARLELFHDISTPVPVELLGTRSNALATLKRNVRNAALQGLEKLAISLREQGLRVTTAAEWDYPVHEAIVRRAVSSGADLIVTHQRGKHRLPRLLAHTDWELLRESPLPVLLVKSRRPYRGGSLLAAIDPFHAFAKPSGLDARILEEGAVVGKALGIPLHVVHAYQPLPLPPKRRAGGMATADDIERNAGQHAQAAMDRALAPLSIRPGRAHLVEGNPLNVIPATARRLRSAIVIMGAVSRSGLKRLLIGNTAESVIDELACDLLIVKPAHFSHHIPRRRRGMYFVTFPTTLI